MSKHPNSDPGQPTEDEVLRRMLKTPPQPHKAKPAPVKKRGGAKEKK